MALKQTVSKTKRRNKKKKRAPVRSRPRSSSSYLTPSNMFLALFTFIGMSALYMYFYHVDLNGLPPTVTKTAILIPQIATFLVLAATFGFFGYHFLKDKHIWTKMHRIALGVGFSAICLLYFACFSQEISFNGDNAEYMISAQSLVERGGAYRLYTPSETRNTLASIGLPAMLAPIYAIWGLDIFKMKVLVMLFGISVFPLSFRLFREHLDGNMSALLAVTVASSPYLVANTTSVMTEAPYLCWSLLALIGAFRYLSAKKFHGGYYAATLIFIVLAYLTRAVGIAILVATLGTLLLHIPWRQLRREESWQGVNRQSLLKFIAVFLPLVLGFAMLQIIKSQEGLSQIDIFLGKDLYAYFESNVKASIHVVGHMLFSNEAFRWYQMLPNANLSPVGLGFAMTQVLILVGLIRGLLSRDLKAHYALTALLLIWLASMTPQEMVIIRYVSVLVPFFIFYFVDGVDSSSQYLFDRLKVSSSWQPLVPVMALAMIFVIGMMGNITNLGRAKSGIGPHGNAYLAAASWCGKNLPADSYIMSFKPRITYLYSGLKGKQITSGAEEYNEEYAREKLAEIEREGITHLIIDALAGKTQSTIVPILQNNPHLFEVYNIPELQQMCTVIRYTGRDSAGLD